MGRWKVVLAAALALPMLAYVAGSLAAADDKPGDRSPIRIDEPTTESSTSPGSAPTGTTKPSPTSTPDKKGRPDGDGPRTVTRVPDDLDDDDDDDGRGRRDDDDDDDGDDDD